MLILHCSHYIPPHWLYYGQLSGEITSGEG
jgi:hypothetical protein